MLTFSVRSIMYFHFVLHTTANPYYGSSANVEGMLSRNYQTCVIVVYLLLLLKWYTRTYKSLPGTFAVYPTVNGHRFVRR